MRFVGVGVFSALFAAVAGAQSAQSSADKVAKVIGRVTDQTSAPLSLAEVKWQSASGAQRSVLTDSVGQFEVPELPSGDRTLQVRRLGYRSRPVSLDARASDTGRLPDIALEPIPRELREVLVVENEDDMHGKLAAFYARKANNRFGTFIEREAFVKKNLPRASEVLRSVSGVQLQTSGRIGSVVRLHGCKPMIYLDGQRVPGAELDEIVTVSDVAAIEVYPTLGAIPPQFLDLSSRCGSIVVWLR
jgi:Carboxypeptidase regulatory-like domain